MNMNDHVVIAEALREIADKEGRLTPRQVVDHARDPVHPLHDHFEWDDTEAAERFRHIQARSLIRRVRMEIVVETQTVRVPAYLRDPDVPAEQQGYRQLLRIKSDPHSAHEALAEEMSRAASALRRARSIAAALDLDDEVAALEIAIGDFIETHLTDEREAA